MFNVSVGETGPLEKKINSIHLYFSVKLIQNFRLGD